MIMFSRFRFWNTLENKSKYAFLLHELKPAVLRVCLDPLGTGTALLKIPAEADGSGLF